MTSKLALTFALLLGAYHAKADIVETTVNIALKIHVQQPAPPPKGDTQTFSYTVTTLKNSDLINAIGSKASKLFSKDARIILKQIYTGVGVTTDLIIRDQNYGDTDIDSYLTMITPHAVQKGKSSISKKTGSASMLSLCELNIELGADDEGYFLTGPLKATFKTIKSISDPQKVVNINNFSATLSGHSKIGQDTAQYGYVTGTLKGTGSKLIK